MDKERYIVHVDMDAFFAAIEQRDDPYLRGKPVIVGADPRGGRGRGVVSTCSYEARTFGVHSAMPISAAYRACPRGIFVPVDMAKYAAVSGELYDIFYRFTPQVEPVSIDEAFLDITGSAHIYGSAVKLCLKIKKDIVSSLGLTASVGLAPTKMAAKIASELKKPDGFIRVPSGSLKAFLCDLPIEKIPGLGPKTKAAMNALGITTIGGLSRRKPDQIIRAFGKNGFLCWMLARGEDHRSIQVERQAKSCSSEKTFAKDTEDIDDINRTLFSLCEKVSARLRQDGLKGERVTLKIRLSGFQTHTRTRTVSGALRYADTLYREVKTLYDSFDRHGRKVRLLGVSVALLMPAGPYDTLFPDPLDRKREGLQSAVDIIRTRWGNSAIRRAFYVGPKKTMRGLDSDARK